MTMMYLWYFVLPYLKAGSALLLGQGFGEGKMNVRQSLVFVLKDQHQKEWSL